MVLPNAVNRRFIEAGRGVTTARPLHDPPRIFCLSAGHWHKNSLIIPWVIRSLVQTISRNGCTFIVTLPYDSKVWRSVQKLAERLGVVRWLENVGPLSLDECVEHYREADCLFLPTLAEIFSATYLEAMAMRVPIVTTDLDFARAICGDAAVYFEPLSADAAAGALNAVLTDRALRETLVRQGVKRLGEFPDPESKHRALLGWLVGLARAEGRRNVC
jgi:glycosyltransferase involved in cell wall biosynthesis